MRRGILITGLAWLTSSYDPASIGCLIGTGTGGLGTMENALSNSFGSGGNNAVLCLRAVA